MARTYKRDSRGRFASGGGSGGGRKSAKPVTLPARKPGGKSSGGHLLKRQAVKDAKAKLAKMDSADRSYSGTLRRRAQKAAVTRASNALKAAKQGGKVRLSGRSERSGVIRPGRGGVKKAQDVSSGTMSQRIKRTNYPTRSITPNVDDRPPMLKPQASLTRRRARDVYAGQLLRGTGRDGSWRLTREQASAPFGRFSTVRNPAPAKSFPSQAPGRTVKGEAVARQGRRSASAKRRRR
jgi:hypothetical protein